MWERYLWVTFAYAIVLERVEIAARVQAARARLYTVRNFGATSLAEIKKKLTSLGLQLGMSPDSTLLAGTDS